MGFNVIGLPKKFDPRRVSPGNLRAWFDASRITDLADGAAFTVWPDLANPGVPFSDDFNRADSATTLGNGWTALAGTWGISAGRAYSVTDAQGNVTAVASGLADGIVSCVVNGDLNGPGTDFRVPALAFRITTANTMLYVQLYNGAISLWKIDGGAYTTLATVATTTNDNTDYTIKAVLSGNSITVYKDGASLITYTLAGGDTKYAGYTSHGMILFRAGAPTSSARWDNFLVAKLTDAIQTTAANQPVFKTGILSGRPVVRFDGVNDYLTNLFASAQSNPVTVFVVMKFAGFAANQNVTDGITAGARMPFLYSVGSGVALWGTTAITTQFTSTSFGVLVGVNNNTASAIVSNGSSLVAGSNGTFSVTGLTIGARYDGTNPLNGDIAEILVYNVALTTAQRRRVERYLANKWGITLTRQVVEDTFTRTDSATTLGNAETGQVWTPDRGTWGINSNKARMVASVSFNYAFVETGVSDATVQATFSTTTSNQYLLFRFTDSNNHLLVESNIGSGVYSLYKRVGGTYSSIGSYAVAPASGDVIRVQLSGSSVTVFINGTQRITASVTDHQTATKHGIGVAGDVNARWDDFTVEVAA